MSSSGNGPTVIHVTPSTYEADDDHGDATNGFPADVRKNRMRSFFSNLKKIRVEEADTRPPKPTFQQKLPAWVRAAKPADDPLQRLLWWIYVIFGLYKTKAQPPKEVSFFRLRKVINASMAAVNSVREETAAIVSVIAVQGGVGKTTISTWLAATLAWASKLSVAIIDTDRGGGLVASRFKLTKVKMTAGQIKRPMSIYELGRRIANGEIFTPEKLIAETVSDPDTGIMIFHAPPGRGMGIGQTENVLKHVRSQFAGGMVVDTTPGLRVPMTDAAVNASQVNIIVVRGLSDESITGVRTALNYEPYKLRESIGSVLVVVAALPLKKCNMRTAYELIDGYNLRPRKSNEALSGEETVEEEKDLVEVSAEERLYPSQILFLPSDRYMDTRRVRELKRVWFPAVRPRTQLALAQLAKAKDDIVLKQRAKG